jgi:hypothetical protein
MTPTELHTLVRGWWEEMRDTARAATPGPWIYSEGDEARGIMPASLDLDLVWTHYDADSGIAPSDADGRHIAAFNPSFAIAVCEAALERLDRHAPRRAYDYEADVTHQCEYCASLCHSHSGLGCDSPDAPWPCDDFLSDAAPFRTRPDFPEELKA